jgi:hypothetical protein
MARLRVMRLAAALIVLVGTIAVRAGSPNATANDSAQHWEIAGTLTEACTCSVPCTCNFGEAPSPHHYCWSVFSLEIEKGHYGAIKLDGLHLAVAHAQSDRVAYIDESATPDQAAALKAIGSKILAEHNFSGVFDTAKITQTIGETSASVQLGKAGGFDADYIIGRDGKTPVVVENNTTFNIPRSTKTKTKVFRYKDAHGNAIDTTATNGNQGKFDWSDQTESYFD